MKISDEDIRLAIVAMLASGTLTGKELYNRIILALGGRIISPWWFITGRPKVIEYYNVIHARICGNIVVIRAIKEGIEDPNVEDLILLETTDTWHDVAANERPSERNVVSYLPYAFWRDTVWKYIQDGYGDILLLGENF